MISGIDSIRVIPFMNDAFHSGWFARIVSHGKSDLDVMIPKFAWHFCLNVFS